MKFVNRIFLVLGAMSMFSLVQFDAIAVNDCSTAPKAGKYCQKPNNKPDCPTGCWCEGQATYHLEGRVSQNRVAEICRNKDASVYELRQLHYAKVYVCGVDYTGIPYGNSDPHGFAGTEINYNTGVLKSYSEPKQSALTNCKIHPKPINSEAGRFWNGNATIGCPPGCYCDGSYHIVDLDVSKVNNACLYHTLGLVNGFDVEGYLELRGIHYCPQGYTHALRGAKTITDCKNADGQNYTPSGLSGFINSGLTEVLSGNDTAYHCAPGQYLSNSTGLQLFNGTGSVTSSFNRFGTTCADCPAGWYCPGDDEKYQCTGTRKYSTAGKSACLTCPVGRQANSTHTGCEPATINMGSTNVVAQRVDDLVALEATCLNGGTPHSVNFVRGNGSASGSTSSFNNKCQGVTITLPDCGFSLPGYTFNRWSCDNNIGTKVAGATFTMPNANVTCTAQWTAVPLGTYTVQYLCGDGFGIAPVDNSSYAHNDSVTLKSNTCTAPSGDTFYKWSCDNGIGTQAENATFYMPNANVTCTAQWTYSGSTGDDNGGGTGGSTGGDNGGGTGGSTGGDNGGGTGGSTGGDNTGDGDDNTPVSCTTPGKYWNGDYCENCESGYFCPGDGDEYRCPLSGTTTTNRASCKLNVSKTQMYGNNGNKCWKYTGVSRASNYRDCVYGDHLENYLH